MIYSFTLLMLFVLLTPPNQIVYLDYSNMQLSGSWINYEYNLVPTQMVLTPDANLQSSLQFDASITIRSIYSDSEVNYPVPTSLKSVKLFSHDESMLQVAYNIYFMVLNNRQYATPDGLFDLLTKLGVVSHKVYLLPVSKNPLKEYKSQFNNIQYTVGALIDYGDFKFLIIPYGSVEEFNQKLYIPVMIDAQTPTFFSYKDVNGIDQPLTGEFEVKAQGVTMSGGTFLQPTLKLVIIGGQTYLQVKNPNDGYIVITVSNAYKTIFDTVIAKPGDNLIPLWFTPSRFFVWEGMTYVEIRNVPKVVESNVVLVPQRSVFYSGETIVINAKILPESSGDVIVVDLTTQKQIKPVTVNYQTNQITFTAPEVPLFSEDAIQVSMNINGTSYTTYVFVKPPINILKADYDTQNGVVEIAFSDDPLKPIYRNVIGTLTVQISVNSEPLYTQDISMFNMKQNIQIDVGPPTLSVGTNKITLTIINQLPNGRTTSYSITKTIVISPKDYVRGVVAEVDGGDTKKHEIYENGRLKLKVLLDTFNFGGYEADVKVVVNGQVVVEKAVSSKADFVIKPPVASDFMTVSVLVDNYPAYTGVFVITKPPLTSTLLKNWWVFALMFIVALISYQRYKQLYPEKVVSKERSTVSLARKFVQVWYRYVVSRIGAPDARLIYLDLDPVKRYYIAFWYSPSTKTVYVQVVPEANPTIEYDGFLLDEQSGATLLMELRMAPSVDTVMRAHQQVSAPQNIEVANQFEQMEKKNEPKTLDEEVEMQSEDDFFSSDDEGEDIFGGGNDEEDVFGDLFADEEEEE